MQRRYIYGIATTRCWMVLGYFWSNGRIGSRINWSYRRIGKRTMSRILSLFFRQTMQFAPIDYRTIMQTKVSINWHFDSQIVSYHFRKSHYYNELFWDGVGSFLVRPSAQQPNAYALMLNTGARIDKFLITTTDDGRFQLGGRHFASVNDIVERYKQTDICDGHRLVTAILRSDLTENQQIQRVTSQISCPNAIRTGRAWRKCMLILCLYKTHTFLQQKILKSGNLSI